MIECLSEAIAKVERQRKTIEVYSAAADEAAELAAQFSTKNVSVERFPLPRQAEEGFAVIRGADSAFLGSLGLSTLSAILSPEVHPPWTLARSETAYDEIFDFLDNTLFSSYNRRQMLASAREIEERAWRNGTGRLHTGFQRVAALKSQEEIYRRLSVHEQLSVQLYVNAGWDIDIDARIPVQAVTADEIGAFWFVFYDGGGSELAKCGLIAEERAPKQYYGFWTYDPCLIGELVSYLEATYGGT